MERDAKENSSQYAEILTETYFYLAKQQLKLDHKDEAISLFRLALANQVFNFVEYRFALFELSQIRGMTQTTLLLIKNRERLGQYKRLISQKFCKFNRLYSGILKHHLLCYFISS